MWWTRGLGGFILGAEHCVHAGLYLLPLQRRRMKDQLRERVHGIRQELDRSECRRELRLLILLGILPMLKLHVHALAFCSDFRAAERRAGSCGAPGLRGKCVISRPSANPWTRRNSNVPPGCHSTMIAPLVLTGERDCGTF